MDRQVDKYVFQQVDCQVRRIQACGQAGTRAGRQVGRRTGGRAADRPTSEEKENK